jgi:hypothetical protein
MTSATTPPPNTSSLFRPDASDTPQAKKRVAHAWEHATADSRHGQDKRRTDHQRHRNRDQQTAVGSGAFELARVDVDPDEWNYEK